MKRSLGVWTAAAIVVLSACTQTPRDLTLPLDQNAPGPDVVRAEEHLVTECLAAYGVTAGELRRRHPNAGYLGWLGEPETGYSATGEYAFTGDAEAVYLGTVERHGGRTVPGGGCRQAVHDLLRPPRKDPLDVLAQQAAGAAGQVIAAGGPAMADVKAYTTELEAAAATVLAGDHTRTW
ncbi:hypothetical protein [Herbidospora sp. NBRC 101105]|uniref:hypothetical protein n=1 Tax=Herbidospora sp. NBRC 101105 TaxID=3032195 RepID=UPI00255426AE|nr:hypothetical protein [Herbidospora sp. NBRC 101105]